MRIALHDHLSECTSGAELHRKIVACAFWNSKLEAELREQGQIEYKLKVLMTTTRQWKKLIYIIRLQLSTPTKLVQLNIAEEVSNENLIDAARLNKIIDAGSM